MTSAAEIVSCTSSTQGFPNVFHRSSLNMRRTGFFTNVTSLRSPGIPQVPHPDAAARYSNFFSASVATGQSQSVKVRTDENPSSLTAQLVTMSLACKSSPSLPVVQYKGPPHLLRLPVELHLKIKTYISPPHDGSLLCLRLANRYFHSIISTPDHAAVLRIEKMDWARQRALFACRHCPKRNSSIGLRHRSAFADAMMKGKTGANGSTPEKRFCADCGFHMTKPKLYKVGHVVTVNGIAWVQCIRCNKVSKRLDVSGKRSCEVYLCGKCHECRCAACERDGLSAIVREAGKSN